MKKIFIVLAVLIPVIAKAQSPNNFEFTFVDSVDLPKDDIYIRARSWVATTFKSSQHVIQMEDKDAGRIICKGNFPHPAKNVFGNTLCFEAIHFTLTIDVKDGRYRTVYNDMHHTGCNYPGGALPTGSGGSLSNEKPGCGTLLKTRKQWKDIQKDAVTQVYAARTSLLSSIAGTGIVIEDDF